MPAYVEFESVHIQRLTEDAALVDFGLDDPIWIPLSQFEEIDFEEGEVVDIWIEDWIAIEKGLV